MSNTLREVGLIKKTFTNVNLVLAQLIRSELNYIQRTIDFREAEEIVRITKFYSAQTFLLTP